MNLSKVRQLKWIQLKQEIEYDKKKTENKYNL